MLLKRMQEVMESKKRGVLIGMSIWRGMVGDKFRNPKPLPRETCLSQWMEHTEEHQDILKFFNR